MKPTSSLMKIIICGSLKAEKEILEAKEKLEKRSFEVKIPMGIKIKIYQGRTIDNVSTSEKADNKIKYDVIKQYFNLIKESDAVLVVNPELNGIKGYIGGNTLMEMGFAHVLNKSLYCLYQLPKMSYSTEILAMQPVVLNEDLNKIKEFRS